VVALTIDTYGRIRALRRIAVVATAIMTDVVFTGANALGMIKVQTSPALQHSLSVGFNRIVYTIKGEV